MNNVIINIPRDIAIEAEKYFDSKLVLDGHKLIILAKISISFQKGSPESYFVVSGIVNEDRSYDTKIVYKKRLENTIDGPFTSSCNCKKWTKQKHCNHVAGLFINYYLQVHQDSETSSKYDPVLSRNSLRDSPPIITPGELGVTPDRYGTIIEGPSKLINAPSTATYSSLSYVLHNSKRINFPIPSSMKGKLVFSINNKFKNIEGNITNFDPISFKYIDENNNIINEISILENLYLFNWKLGQVYYLPKELKNVVQKIRINFLSFNQYEILTLIKNEEISKNIYTIEINDNNINDIPIKDSFLRVEIDHGDKRGNSYLHLTFLNSDDKIIQAPNELKALTFSDDGLLNTFRKKQDAYDFIDKLQLHFSNEDSTYKKLLASNSKKQKWINLIEGIVKNEESLVFDEVQSSLYKFDNSFIKNLISSICNNFDPSVFRYADICNDTKRIKMLVTNNLLFQGISSFYNEMKKFGVTVYYNKKEVSNWKSRIRFERRNLDDNFFNLDLEISDEELEFIKNASLENNLALSSNSLTLLTQDQKEILKFIQKYTKYESIDQKKLEKDEEQSTNIFVIPFNKARIFELFELHKMGIKGALTNEEEEVCKSLTSLKEIPNYPVPEKLDKILRKYQITGYRWLRFLYEHKLGACLADDMGLGKTLQSITFIKSIENKINQVLVVCPVSILLNWKEEIKKFSDIETYVYHGGDRKISDSAKIIITSYGIMKRELDTTFSNKHFDILILDEVQNLKNIRSIGAAAARNINTDFRICLTGTPVENDLAEFYNIIDLSVPGIWGNLQFIRTTSTKKTRLLARKTAAPFVLRRTKDQVLTDLPEKIENTVFLNFSEKERDNYEQSLNEIKYKIKLSPPKKKYGEVLKGLLHLRQKCLWQNLLNDNTEKSYAQKNFLSTKIDFLLETVEQIREEGHQAIIFSQFTTYLDIIQKAMRERHWTVARIDGTQSIKKRQEQVDLFQNKKVPIILISLKAGGTGLNLTAASYVFLMDPWWNPAVEAQAIDRAHRIGQDKKLTVYRPIIKNSIEDKVLELQKIKKELFNDLLKSGNDGYFEGKLSMKDFESLFELD